MKNKGIVGTILSVTLMAFVQPGEAATVDAQICLSATVVNQSPVDVIFGSGGPVCASVSGSAVATIPGEKKVFSDTRNEIVAAGGVNSSGTTVNYTIQFDWTYLINTAVLGANETATALVRSDFLGIEFVSGSGSGSRTFVGSVENSMAVDYFADLFVTGNATSIAPVPLPTGLFLFVSGLVGLSNIMWRRWKASN